jgi:hypothetical protein
MPQDLGYTPGNSSPVWCPALNWQKLKPSEYGDIYDHKKSPEGLFCQAFAVFLLLGFSSVSTFLLM